ncbi:hypothetical protein SAMD00019534_069070 [Acytostelium subglobosum LB1]|uniref:hypothetical protein n=1 Tax=Acytostelium subglobosum LB1 TaxID=1410327 RepID=UPI000644FE54|nr:hypothetical protein SAMD00019534_069070 [Acytostelium subglobosum LB1]GAM23732.1 hypothetical protein SAMD00019534_069070 [Acytostelium subglobosum LB1]|eukprot:XP_012753473.1 hypothetical protein SAMD00019534_069070 [Acytostelium subglobosum LB1]
MDQEEGRQKAGFKGRNFVYMDRKFCSKFYWKGYSSIIGDAPCERWQADSDLDTADEDCLGLDPASLVVVGDTPPPRPSEQAFPNKFSDRSLVGFVYWSSYCEGPPECVHGGALASVFDDYGEQPVQLKKYAVTVNLSVNYKKFVPLLSVSLIEAWIERREGKKIFIKSTMKDQNGIVRAEATAIWVVVNMPSDSQLNPFSSISTPTPSGSPRLQ